MSCHVFLSSAESQLFLFQDEEAIIERRRKEREELMQRLEAQQQQQQQQDSQVQDELKTDDVTSAPAEHSAAAAAQDSSEQALSTMTSQSLDVGDSEKSMFDRTKSQESRDVTADSMTSSSASSDSSSDSESSSATDVRSKKRHEHSRRRGGRDATKRRRRYSSSSVSPSSDDVSSDSRRGKKRKHSRSKRRDRSKRSRERQRRRHERRARSFSSSSERSRSRKQKKKSKRASSSDLRQHRPASAVDLVRLQDDAAKCGTPLSGVDSGLIDENSQSFDFDASINEKRGLKEVAKDDVGAAGVEEAGEEKSTKKKPMTFDIFAEDADMFAEEYNSPNTALRKLNPGYENPSLIDNWDDAEGYYRCA